MFQSPQMRGGGCNALYGRIKIYRQGVSIPSNAGWWLQREGDVCRGRGDRGFNPLKCGVVVATRAGSYRQG